MWKSSVFCGLKKTSHLSRERITRLLGVSNHRTRQKSASNVGEAVKKIDAVQPSKLPRKFEQRTATSVRRASSHSGLQQLIFQSPIRVSLRRTKVSLRRTKVSLRPTKVSLRRTKVSLRRTRFSLRRPKVSVRRTKVSLRRTKVHLWQKKVCLPQRKVS